jgi:hypothetical protein
MGAYIGPAWAAEIKKHDMEQEMAWQRAVRTDENIAGGLFGTIGYGL